MKRFLTNKTRRLNILLAVLIMLAVLLTVLINMLAFGLSEKYPLSADLTANAAYDLGEDTREILNGLTEEVKIYVLSGRGSFVSDPYLIQMRTLLEKYPKLSEKISLEFVDYVTDPAFAARFPELSLSAGDVLVSGPFDVKQLPLANMFTYTYDQEGNLSITGSRVEEAVTGAVLGAVSKERVRIGILTGNAVSEDRNVLKAILTGNNYEVSEADMVTAPLDPFDVLLLLSPAQDLSEDVLKRFDSFLYNKGDYGKTILYAAGAEQAELPNINTFLSEWGIGISDGAVFETDENNVYGYQPYYPFAEYTDETFRDLLKDSSKRMLMPAARPMELIYTYKDNKTVTTPLSFSASGRVRPSSAGSNFTADQAVKKGPMPAAVMSTIIKGGASGYSNVIVFSSSYAFSSEMLSNTSIANTEYLTAMLSSITGRDSAVSIEPKSLAGYSMAVTAKAAGTWGIILCAVLPAVILLTGIAVYLTRRYR